MHGDEVLQAYGEHLTEYERAEVGDYPAVYWAGLTASKPRATLLPGDSNHGFDDDRGDYNVVLHDHLLYRYEILSVVGKGSFGQVVRAYDHKSQQHVAIKIIRNKSRFHRQALVEVKVLNHLREHDPRDETNSVRMLEHFSFRSHLCIVFELLSMNLYEFIKNNSFMGVSLPLIRRFAVQLLNTLRYLRRHHIVHCDLKPENVLLCNPGRSAIKVIDFGSSCFEAQPVYTYIQSRFYRCPEVILGLPYFCAIDMWSFGCILAELYTGHPLFPGENELEQLACIMEVLGPPPAHLVAECSRRKQFFDSDGQPRIVANSKGRKRRPASTDIMSALHCTDVAFVSFLEGCLRWDATERFSPDEALRHEWILEVSTNAAHPAARTPTHTLAFAPQSTAQPSSANLFATRSLTQVTPAPPTSARPPVSDRPRSRASTARAAEPTGHVCGPSQSQYSARAAHVNAPLTNTNPSSSSRGGVRHTALPRYQPTAALEAAATSASSAREIAALSMAAREIPFRALPAAGADDARNSRTGSSRTGVPTTLDMFVGAPSAGMLRPIPPATAMPTDGPLIGHSNGGRVLVMPAAEALQLHTSNQAVLHQHSHR